MSKIEFVRGKKQVEFSGQLFLSGRDKNIVAFRKLCAEYGAAGIFSARINSKKDIDFEKEIIIANVNAGKMLKDLEKNESVKAYYLDVNSENLDKVIKGTTKPIILAVKPNESLDNLSKANGALIESVENDTEATLDYRLVERIKSKFKIPVISKSKLVTPEEIYGVLRKTESDGVALGEIAFSQPVIFEQTTNYFEKGYYNKITRKRREKTVELFEEIYSKQEEKSAQELNEFKEVFMND